MALTEQLRSGASSKRGEAVRVGVCENVGVTINFEGGSMSTTQGETPVLDLLAEMTTASIERSELDPRTLMLVRLAALVSVDAPPVSYLMNLELGSEVGVEAEDIQQVMIGIAPVVGTARVAAAAGNIVRALGLAIEVADHDVSDPGIT